MKTDQAPEINARDAESIVRLVRLLDQPFNLLAAEVVEQRIVPMNGADLLRRILPFLGMSLMIDVLERIRPEERHEGSFAILSDCIEQSGVRWRRWMIEGIPQRAARVAEAMLRDPEIKISDLIKIVEVLQDERIRALAANLLFERTRERWQAENASGNGSRNIADEAWICAHIASCHCQHGGEALQQLIGLPWKWNDEGTHQTKDASVQWLMRRCHDESVRCLVACHAIEPCHRSTLAEIIVRSPSVRDAAWNALAEWCHKEVPLALAGMRGSVHGVDSKSPAIPSHQTGPDGEEYECGRIVREAQWALRMVERDCTELSEQATALLVELKIANR